MRPIEFLRLPIRSGAFLQVMVAALIAAPAPVAAQLTGYDTRGAFLAAAGPTTVQTFEGFPLGTVLSNNLTDFSSVSGRDLNGIERNVLVGSSSSLPFPMFSDALPSGTHFVSVDMASPSFATGDITFTFSGAPRFAAGAFIADNSPINGFGIEAFFGTTSLGSIFVGPRNLPSSFVGLTSTTGFTAIRFFAGTANDSWGLDDLEYGAVAVPEPSSVILLSLGAVVFAFGRRARSRRS
ncbi:MAG: hypothetical protein C0516_12685 [Gemmatimonas sp.]|nr:hypothetical protein [Gemmatimonas sp.]